MPLSRLRLRLGAWFALAFVISLTVLNLLLYIYLRHQSSRRVTQSLRDDALELAEAVRLEYRENPAGGLADAAKEAFAEWPPHPGAFAIYTERGDKVKGRGDTAQLRRMPATFRPADTSVTDIAGYDGYPLRQVIIAAEGTPRFLVRAAGSTKPIHDETAALALWLGLTPPIVLALSLIGGYLLSRRALAPVEHLAHTVAAIAPNELDRRLPVGRTPDEIDHLATQFNGLLERLQRAGQQNRRFVQHAAHQIRTPLTLVLGEADLSLDRPRTPAEQRQTLERIRAAATQMKRRVDELSLLAQAEAGDRPTLNEAVELDGLVLECADLMRARAQALGQRLELLQVEAVSVRGNEALLKEAVLELIENACRYGTTERPIAISAYQADGAARLRVASSGGPAATPIGPESTAAAPAGRRGGLGLTIVRWIASEHGGTLAYEYDAGYNAYRLVLPVIDRDPL